jgi:endonuclease/exonuclease/phosphatase family metal-dependent hydrolase
MHAPITQFTALALLSSMAHAQPALNDPIVLDGQFNEWPPVVLAARDDTHLFLQLILQGDDVNLQGLDAPAVFMLDVDNNLETGGRNLAMTGADLEVLFSPTSGRRSGGVQVRFPNDSTLFMPDAVQLAFAPTTAARRFELQLPRVIQSPNGPIDVGDTIRWSLAGSLGAHSGTSACGPTRSMPPRAFNAIPTCPPNGIRVVSWNVEFGGILDHPDPFVRILKALQPDVVLLQELESDQTAQAIAAVLEEADGKTWTVDLGPAGGRLRTAVATHLSSTDMPAIDRLKRIDSPKRGVKAAGLRIPVPGVGHVAMVSLHLKCCGVAGGPEDMTRIAEVLAVRRALAQAQANTSFDAVLLGGDLNLVGGRLPLELLVRDGESLFGSDGDFLIADPIRPAGQGFQTWGKDGQRYSPGRLDWVVLSGSTLQSVNAFVLATSELSAAVLQKHELKADDAAKAADHLPIVVDIAAIEAN